MLVIQNNQITIEKSEETKLSVHNYIIDFSYNSDIFVNKKYTVHYCFKDTSPSLIDKTECIRSILGNAVQVY